MHPSFRDGFEKRADQPFNKAWWGTTHPGLAANKMMASAKRGASDFASGVGIGKGLMPKAFGLMTLTDVISKTKDAVGRNRSFGI